MKRKIIVTIIFLFSLMILSGCKTVYVPVDRVHTEYQDRLERDSIHILDSIYIREKGDTIWLTRWRVEYRDRIKVDSVHIRDSVPVPYPVEVIKTVEKKLSKWQRLKMETGGIALGILILILIYFAVKLYRNIRNVGWKGLMKTLFKNSK